MSDWQTERFIKSLQLEINRLRALIRAAARRADDMGLAYDEFDALIDETKKQTIPLGRSGFKNGRNAK